MSKTLLGKITITKVLNGLLWAAVLLSISLRLVVSSYERPLFVAAGQERFEVEKGSGLLQVAYDFEERSWIDFPRFVTLYGRLLGYADGLKAGEYAIDPGMTLKQLLSKMRKGDVITYQLTFVEGQTFQDFLHTLENTQGIVRTLPALDAENVLKALAIPYSSPEGWLFPDTYFYEKGESDVAILKRAYHLMEQTLEREWKARDKDLPYASPYDALIMASIVEKETAVEEERGRIAGVFVRRLQSGMRLQTDPTVIYGMGDRYNGNITRQDLVAPGPYNTYLNLGLPPTPIANPGEASIHAALNPEPGDVLYFVATGEGRHQFSVTLEEHEKAVDEYQRKRRTDYRSSPAR